MKQPRRSRASAPAAPPPTTAISPLAIAGGCALLAIAVRLVYLSAIARAPFFTVLMGDSRGYDLWARTLAAGDWIGKDVFYQAPLYPYFMGVVYAIAGHDVYALRVVQAVLGSISCGLLAHATARLFSTRAAVIAGVALALYPAAIFFDGLLQKTALDAFLTALSLWLISGILVGRARLGTWLALGMAMGALGLTRENALVLIVVILAWALFPARTPASETVEGPGFSPGYKPAIAFLIGVSLLLVPVAIRNAAVGGGFYLTTSQFGPNLYLGNNARTDGTAGSLISGRGSSEYERQDAVDIAERAAGRPLTPGEVSSYWTGQTLAFIRAQPVAWLRLMGRKTLLLWNRAEAFDTESQESYAEFWPPLRWLATLGNFGVLVPLAAIGVFVTWPDRKRLAIVYAIVLAYSASVVLFFIYARYRFPLVPFLILFAAVALAEGLSFLRSRSMAQRATVAAGVVALIVFANWPILSATEMRAITEHNLGAALQSEGQLDAAIDRYLRAVTIKPDYVPSYSNLGAALMARGRTTDAIEAYRRALSIDPAFADAHFNLANALAKEGKAHEAVDHYRAALASAPTATDVRTNLGLALIADQQPDAGRAELETAVRLSPNDAIARYTLGHYLLEAGRPAEALEHLRAAATPEAPADVHNDVGIALANLGRLDEAIAEFQLALKREPSNAEVKRNLELTLANRSRR